MVDDSTLAGGAGCGCEGWWEGGVRSSGERGGTACDSGVGRIRAWRNWPLLQLDVAAIGLG